VPKKLARPTLSALLLPAVVVPTLLASLTACASGNASPAPARTSTPAAPARAARTFVLTERDTGFVFTPKGGKPSKSAPTAQPKAGDVLAVTADVLQNGSTAGRMRYTNAFLPGNMVAVDGPLDLKDGRLLAHGTVPMVEPLVIPIVSGTGAYAGYTGTVQAKGVAANQAQLSFTLK
jgi:hypothetical protein